MKHEHVWVKVWSNGVRNVYRCDIRRRKSAWKFCGEYGYDVREPVFPQERFIWLAQERLAAEMAARLRQREFGHA
jgi:hypothetical protein